MKSQMKQIILAGTVLAAIFATGCASDRASNNVSRLHNNRTRRTTVNTARNTNTQANTHARRAITNAVHNVENAVTDARRSIANNAAAHTTRPTAAPIARRGIVTDRTGTVRHNDTIAREPVALYNNTNPINNRTAALPNSVTARKTAAPTVTASPTATASPVV